MALSDLMCVFDLCVCLLRRSKKDKPEPEQTEAKVEVQVKDTIHVNQQPDVKLNIYIHPLYSNVCVSVQQCRVPVPSHRKATVCPCLSKIKFQLLGWSLLGPILTNPLLQPPHTVRHRSSVTFSYSTWLQALNTTICLAF